MADNYLQFSETLDDLTDEEEAWLKSQLECICIIDGVEYSDGAVPIELDNDEPEWEGCRVYQDMQDRDLYSGQAAGFEYEFHGGELSSFSNRYLWIYATEHAELACLVHLIRKFLQKFRPNDSWTLTYALTCSKLRAGEFGGGAVFVTAERDKWNSANYFISKEFYKWQRKKAKRK